MNATERRDHIRDMLADLRLPGALEAVDEILADVDRGSLHASEAIERLLSGQITLRNNHRLRTAMRSSGCRRSRPCSSSTSSPRSAVSRSRASTSSPSSSARRT